MWYRSWGQVNGAISLEEGEGGLQQIQQHVALMAEGEGII